MANVTNRQTSQSSPQGMRVPARPSELNAEWLGACLRDAGVLGASDRVAGFELDHIGQGRGFGGQIARVVLRYQPGSVTAPATLIAKFAADHAGTREMLRLVDGYAREVRFYRELAPELGMGTPRCYFAHHDPATQDCCLLLEDLAPAESVDPDQGFSLEQAQQVLEQLAAMHARHWNRVEHLEWLQADAALMDNVCAGFVKGLPTLLERYGTQYPTLARAAQQVVPLLSGDEAFAQARRPPLTLAHGDIHIDNVFFPSTRGGRFAIIDWQSVQVSHLGANDVARLLVMGLRPEQRRLHGRALLRHYHRALCAHGVRNYSLRRLRMRYREELVAMVVLTVLVLTGVDFTEDGAARYAGRVDAALADDHTSRLLTVIGVLLPVLRWFRRLFGRA
ncbi:MAG TPA: oxidoreductase family protein [Polyangiales bacterium]|nr:oxidoreductase family protein [Polyangiales bacterium]